MCKLKFSAILVATTYCIIKSSNVGMFSKVTKLFLLYKANKWITHTSLSKSMSDAFQFSEKIGSAVAHK